MSQDLYLQKQQIFGGVAAIYLLATTDTTKDIIAAKTATALFAVQKLNIVVTVGSAGKTLTLGSHSADVVLTPALDMSTAGVEYDYDFGPKGVPFLTAGDAIKATISAAGAAAVISVTGYWKVS
jgi:hypothetical protein